MYLFFFFFNDTATTEIYTLSLHDALPISCVCTVSTICWGRGERSTTSVAPVPVAHSSWLSPYTKRSEEHTSELQSRPHLVCRLLLEKKKTCTVHIRLILRQMFSIQS